jgi:hypothetical protein
MASVCCRGGRTGLLVVEGQLTVLHRSQTTLGHPLLGPRATGGPHLGATECRTVEGCMQGLPGTLIR